MSEMFARLIDVAVTPTSVLPPLLDAVAEQVAPFGAALPVVVVVPLLPAVPFVQAVPPVAVPLPVVPGPVAVGPCVVWVATPLPAPPAWMASARCFGDSRAPQPAMRKAAHRSASGASRRRERTEPPLTLWHRFSTNRCSPGSDCPADSPIPTESWRNLTGRKIPHLASLARTATVKGGRSRASGLRS